MHVWLDLERENIESAWFGVGKCRICTFGNIWNKKILNLHDLKLKNENVEFAHLAWFAVGKRQICTLGTILNEKTLNVRDLHVWHDFE